MHAWTFKGLGKSGVLIYRCDRCGLWVDETVQLADWECGM